MRVAASSGRKVDAYLLLAIYLLRTVCPSDGQTEPFGPREPPVNGQFFQPNNVSEFPQVSTPRPRPLDVHSSSSLSYQSR